MKRLSSILAPFLFAAFALFCWQASLATAQSAPRAAVLEIRLDAPSAADAGTPFTYTLVVSNTGNGVAATVVVTNTVPAGANHVSGGSLTGSNVTWQVGSIAPGTQISVSYAVTATNTVTNDNYLARSGSGITAQGNQPVTTFIRTPDLSIAKQGPATAQPLAPITYTLSVTNSGSLTATNLLITDALPLNASYLSGGTLANGTVSWGVPSLAPAESITLTMTVTATRPITNTDYGVTADLGFGSRGAEAVPTTVPTPVLSITKAGPSAALPGFPITYVLTVGNGGTFTATNLLITDTLPLNAAYLGGGALNGNVVQWQRATLPPGQTVTVTFAVSASQTITNSLYGVAADYGFGAVGAGAVRTESAFPQLAIVKEGPATTSANRPVTYTLTISNDGTFTATNLLVTDTLPTGATYLGGGTFDGTVVSWTIPDLAPGSAVSTSFAVTTAQTITNDDYAVTADGGYGAIGSDPVVTLFEAPALAIAKNGPAVAGFLAPITYTITVTNGGTFTATNLLITDALPAGATYLGGGTFDGSTVSWNVPTLAPGGAITTTFAVSATGTITNSDYVVTADDGIVVTGDRPVRTDVLRPALDIDKEGPAAADQGAPITYTLTVTNSGAFTATNLLVTDTLPAGATYVGGGALDGATVRWDVAELAPGDSTRLSFVVTATATITNSDYAVVASGGITARGTGVVVTLVEPAVRYLAYLPAILDIPPPGEENDTCDSAFPMPLNSTRQFFAEDMYDWYTFELATPRDLEVRLTNFAPVLGQIVLYYSTSGSCGALQVVANNGDQSATKIIDAGVQPAGVYYILVITDGPLDTGLPYNLRINAN